MINRLFFLSLIFFVTVVIVDCRRQLVDLFYVLYGCFYAMYDLHPMHTQHQVMKIKIMKCNENCIALRRLLCCKHLNAEANERSRANANTDTQTHVLFGSWSCAFIYKQNASICCVWLCVRFSLVHTLSFCVSVCFLLSLSLALFILLLSTVHETHLEYYYDELEVFLISICRNQFQWTRNQPTHIHW